MNDYIYLGGGVVIEKETKKTNKKKKQKKGNVRSFDIDPVDLTVIK